MLFYVLTVVFILLHVSVVTILKAMNIIYCTVLYIYCIETRCYKLYTLILINLNDLHVDTLLHGSSDYDYGTNKYIFEAVHEFINECDRL